jgi:hypothetical protein
MLYLFSILKTKDVLEILLKNHKISQFLYDKTNDFLIEHRYIPIAKTQMLTDFDQSHELDYESRAKLCQNRVAKKLFEIMTLKQTNLCLSADLNSLTEILKVNGQSFSKLT